MGDPTKPTGNANFDSTGMMAAASGAGQMAYTQDMANSNYAKQTGIDLANAKDLYFMQRRDANKDWERNNQYNSPEMQMARLKAAGLNPNLVYGNGVTGNSSSVLNNPTPQRHGANLENVKVPDLMGNAANIIQTMAQTDNMRQIVEGQKVANEASKLSLKGQKEDYENERGISRGKWETSIEQLNKLKTDRQYTLHQDDRSRDALKDQLVRTATQVKYTDKQIEALKEQIANGQLDYKIKQLQAQLAEDGITPTDPIYVRVIMTFLKNFNNIK